MFTSVSAKTDVDNDFQHQFLNRCQIMSTFNDGCFNIDSRTNVETPPELILNPFFYSGEIL